MRVFNRAIDLTTIRIYQNLENARTAARQTNPDSVASKSPIRTDLT